MQNPIGIVFMVIFTIVTVFVYLAVRRGYLGLMPAAVIGGLGSSLSFFFYSLSQDNPLSQAIIVGAGLGLVFTGLTVGSAAYFRANSRPPRPESADVPPQGQPPAA